MRRILVVFGVLAVLAGACSGDADSSGDDATADVGDDLTADTMALEEREATGLCLRYDAFVTDPTPGAARDFLENDEGEMPPGVLATVLDVADGLDVSVDNVVEYFGAICVGDATSNGENFEFDDQGEGGSLPPATARDACVGLQEVWADGDRAAAARFGEGIALDALFTRRFEPPANNAVRFGNGDCFYTVPGGVADVAIADSDLEAFVFEVVWYSDDEFFADAALAARFEDAD